MAWNYAELSKSAKKAGSPEMYVDMLIKSGEQNMYPKVGIAAGVGLGVGGLITLGIVKIVRYFKTKKAISEEEVARARAEIIKGIKEYDALNGDCDEQGKHSDE